MASYARPLHKSRGIERNFCKAVTPCKPALCAAPRRCGARLSALARCSSSPSTFWAALAPTSASGAAASR